MLPLNRPSATYFATRLANQNLTVISRSMSYFTRMRCWQWIAPQRTTNTRHCSICVGFKASFGYDDRAVYIVNSLSHSSGASFSSMLRSHNLRLISQSLLRARTMQQLNQALSMRLCTTLREVLFDVIIIAVDCFLFAYLASTYL